MRKTGHTMCSSLPNGGGGMGRERNIKGSSWLSRMWLIGNVYWGKAPKRPQFYNDFMLENMYLLGEICGKDAVNRCFSENLPSVWHAGAVPFLYPVRSLGLGCLFLFAF